jgi:hypothetical protein
MKKIIYLTMTVSMIFGLVACDDFLEEKPRSNPDANTFFASRADAYASVNILYRKGMPGMLAAQSAYFGSRLMFTTGYNTGLIENLTGKGQEQVIARCQMLNVDPVIDNNHIQNIWQGCYEAIVRNANYALENLSSCPGLSETERKQLIGEASFFRALNYFYLVKTFGPVPLILNSYQSLENIFVRRSSEKLIYDQILIDLNEALNAGLPNRPMPENGFRISHGSVLALMADVCLNMAGAPINDASKYADAARYAKDIINNSNYALIQHGADITNPDNWGRSAYNTLRTSDREKEYLYVKEFDRTISSGGAKPVFVLPFEASSWGEFAYPTTNLAWDPDPILHAAYDPVNDLRYQEHQYFYSSYTMRKGTNAGVVREFGKKIPYFWWEEDALINSSISEKDYVHYRLAEIYLIAAEAIVKSGNTVTDEAVNYLASIEARASLNKDFETIKAELSGLSTENFVKEVWTEKIRELLFEFKLWNDISRTRMFPAIINDKFGFVPLIGAVNPYGATFTEQNIYFPICDQEIQRNPELKESPL